LRRSGSQLPEGLPPSGPSWAKLVHKAVASARVPLLIGLGGICTTRSAFEPSNVLLISS
jgi:hypothetical protein